MDGVVELYLHKLVYPYLVKTHESLHSNLTTLLRQRMDGLKPDFLPTWFTSIFITYARVFLIPPTIHLLANNHRFLPALLIVVAQFGDFVVHPLAQYRTKLSDNYEPQQPNKRSTSSSPIKNFAEASSDDDMVVLSKGLDDKGVEDIKDSSMKVCQKRQLVKDREGLINGLCTKAYLIFVWILILTTVSSSFGGRGGGLLMRFVQNSILWASISIEVLHVGVTLKSYYYLNGEANIVTLKNGLVFSDSGLTSIQTQKAKQSLQTLGTIFMLLPLFRFSGLLLMMSIIPLGYEMVKCHFLSPRVMYVQYGGIALDDATLTFWSQVKSLGAKLVVGITTKDKKEDIAIRNALACPFVDAVISSAPAQMDILAMSKHNLDFVVLVPSDLEKSIVSDDVFECNRCIVLDTNTCTAYPAVRKAPKKQD